MKLVWIDVETTGLDPNKDAMLEIAVMEATLERPFDYKYPWAFRESWVFGFDGTIEDSVVRDMHTKSGLLAECARSTNTVAMAEEQLLEIVPAIADREEMPVLDKRDTPFCGIVSAVTHEAFHTQHPYARGDSSRVVTTVWIVEELGAPTLYCDCSSQEREQYGVTDGRCDNCGHMREP